jgi:hypothetical protein
LFFNADGTFSQRLKDNCERSGIILHAVKFQNTDKSSQKIRRIQVEFTKANKLFYDIQGFLQDAKLIDFKNEYITDPSLIIGGTQNQQCHADIPRLITSIHDKNNKQFCEPGYEINQEAYNDLLADPYAPSSIMIDLCFNNSCFHFNIPKCYIDKVEGNAKSFIITHDTESINMKYFIILHLLIQYPKKKKNYTQ